MCNRYSLCIYSENIRVCDRNKISILNSLKYLNIIREFDVAFNDREAYFFCYNQIFSKDSYFSTRLNYNNQVFISCLLEYIYQFCTLYENLEYVDHIQIHSFLRSNVHFQNHVFNFL